MHTSLRRENLEKMKRTLNSERVSVRPTFVSILLSLHVRGGIGACVRLCVQYLSW